MVVVLARCSADLLEESVSGAEVVTKKIEEDVITACGFADFEELATDRRRL
jgi:hypothetical protein